MVKSPYDERSDESGLRLLNQRKAHYLPLSWILVTKTRRIILKHFEIIRIFEIQVSFTGTLAPTSFQIVSKLLKWSISIILQSANWKMKKKKKDKKIRRTPIVCTQRHPHSFLIISEQLLSLFQSICILDFPKPSCYFSYTGEGNIPHPSELAHLVPLELLMIYFFFSA